MLQREGETEFYGGGGGGGGNEVSLTIGNTTEACSLLFLHVMAIQFCSSHESFNTNSVLYFDLIIFLTDL